MIDPLDEPSDPPSPDPAPAPSLRGRGAAHNPHNRFERLRYEEDPEFAEFQRHAARADALAPDAADPEPRGPATRFYVDPSRSLLSTNQSPDIGFDASINPYRGCEHGCIYCYARPSHEYLGFSAGLDFESRILVKRDAPKLLRESLMSRRWKPQVVAIGAVTDGYQPIERKLGLTRRCLEVFAEFRNPVSVITKSALVTRDIDIFQELCRFDAALVNVSITTLSRDTHRAMEPRAASPERRLGAIRSLAAAGIPVHVMVAPIVPCINDHEIPDIVEAVAEAGARSASHTMLRLPYGVKDLFENWLERHYPDRKEKVLNRVRSMRDGRLNDPHFHTRMRANGIFAQQTHELFELACRRAGIAEGLTELSTAAFRRPGGPQLSLFGEE